MKVSYAALDQQQQVGKHWPFSKIFLNPAAVGAGWCRGCCGDAPSSMVKNNKPDHHRKIQGTDTSFKDLVIFKYCF